jgi:drug/metabolite transporter (DMT)-like permease
MCSNRNRAKPDRLGVRLSAPFLALIATLGFAATQIAAKRGLQTVSVEAGLVISLGSAWIMIAAATILGSPRSIPLGSVITFAVAGLIAPGIARWATITGVHRLGPSISSPLQQATGPLLAVIGAMIVLGESLRIARATGIALVVIGGWFLGTVRPGTVTEHLPLSKSQATSVVWRRALRPGLMYPLLASLSYAITDILVKDELENSPQPFLAATIGIGSALVVWIGIGMMSPLIRARLRFGSGAGWFMISGLLSASAYLALFSALRKGDVSLVVPILGMQPLVVFILSYLFLGGIERIEPSTVVIGSSIVGGAILISIS